MAKRREKAAPEADTKKVKQVLKPASSGARARKKVAGRTRLLIHAVQPQTTVLPLLIGSVSLRLPPETPSTFLTCSSLQMSVFC